jgi:Omp85 superfamily domain
MPTPKTWVIAVLLALTADRAAAQSPPSTPSVPPPETREDTLRRERLAKQQRLAPHRPNGLEGSMNAVEKKILPLLGRDGLYARLGSLTTGSGFAYGAGFRNRRLFSRHGSGDVWAAASLKHYWTVEGRLNVTPRPSGVVSLDAFARRVHYPREEFFGLGPASLRGDRSDFRLSGTMAGGRATVTPGRFFSVGAEAEFLAPRIDRGTAPGFPPVQDVFSDVAAPGLARQANFIHTSAFAQIDYRRPLNARQGGWYRVDVSRYSDRTNGEFSFRRIEAEIRQYASILAERRVLAVRGWLATTDVDPGGRIPFYLQPALGGNDTLRGFRAFRFRGPHALLLTAEYRFEIWAGLDGALFYDTGKVADRRADLSFRSLERDYGFGFRFNTDNGVIMRVDAAFGSRDGKHLHIVFGTMF